jgi:hypothetical protein
VQKERGMVHAFKRTLTRFNWCAVNKVHSAERDIIRREREIERARSAERERESEREEGIDYVSSSRCRCAIVVAQLRKDIGSASKSEV